jgi:hypothetical protein
LPCRDPERVAYDDLGWQVEEGNVRHTRQAEVNQVRTVTFHLQVEPPERIDAYASGLPGRDLSRTGGYEVYVIGYNAGLQKAAEAGAGMLRKQSRA